MISGQVVFIVYNRSGAPEVDLQIEQRTAAGANTPEAVSRNLLDSRQSRWAKVMDLKPGAYVVSVIGQPKWTCNVRVK